MVGGPCMVGPCSLGLGFSLGSFIFRSSRLVVAAVVVVVVVVVLSQVFHRDGAEFLGSTWQAEGLGSGPMLLSIESIARFTFRGRIQRAATTPGKKGYGGLGCWIYCLRKGADTFLTPSRNSG